MTTDGTAVTFTKKGQDFFGTRGRSGDSQCSSSIKAAVGAATGTLVQRNDKLNEGWPGNIANASFTDNQGCDQARGVTVKIGNAKKAGELPAAGAGSYNGQSGPREDENNALECDNGGWGGLLSNPLNWIICPLVNGIQKAFEAFDNAITNLLTIDTVTLFENPERGGSVASSLYAAWSGFRYIALGLLVVFALVMIISQAIGSGPFDAYTVKRVMPRLLAAIVLIALSWELMKFAIALSNGIGHAVGSLIYQPFSNFDSVNQINTAGVGGALIFGVGGGLVALGPIGLLSFALTGLIGALTALAVLVLREMIVIFLVVLVPVALVCNILPNTQRAWKMWSDYFMRALLLFPLFTGFVAIGRAFSQVATSLYPDSVLGTIVGFVAYLAPYFMLPTMFKMSGGAIATLGGIAAGATAGMQNSLKGFRQNRMKQIHQDRMNAKSWLGGSRAGGAYRRVAAGGRHGSWSPTGASRRRWQDREQLIKDKAAAEMLEAGGARAFNDDDASLLARDRSMTRNRFIRDYQALGHTEEEAQRALARAEQATGARMGSDAMAVAAQRFRVSMTNTAYKSGEEGLAQMQGELKEMVDQGLVTAYDAAGWMKSNKGRADYSANSFGDTVKFVQGQVSAAQQLDGAFKGADPREVVGGHQRTVESFAGVAQRNFDAAIAESDAAAASGDQTRIIAAEKQLDIASADLAGIYDTMSNISPKKAQEFADTVFQRGVVSRGTTVRAVLEQRRNRPPDAHGQQAFLDRRREWRNAGDAHDAQAIAANMAGGGPEEG